MLDVEKWADLRRAHYVRGISIREFARRTGHDQKTIRKALRSDSQPRYERSIRPSKLDPFKDEIHRLLRAEPTLPATRIREEIELLGFAGRQTTVDVYVREVRPLFAPPPRSFQRTHHRAGQLCQFDLWRPAKEIPVGFGQTRPGYVVIACLGYSRLGAAALVFSKEAPDLLWGISRCPLAPRRLAEDDRLGPRGRPACRRRARFTCARRLLRAAQARLVTLRARRSAGQGDRACRAISRPPSSRGAYSHRPTTSRTHSTLGSMSAQTCASTRAALSASDRMPEERQAMAPLPPERPDTDRRSVLRVPPDPHVRVDRNDYSLDPRLVRRRVEQRVSQGAVFRGRARHG